MDIKPIICPKCGSTEYKTYAYGMRVFVNEEGKKKFGEKYIDMGCEVFSDSPKYKCMKCESSFGKYRE